MCCNEEKPYYTLSRYVFSQFSNISEFCSLDILAFQTFYKFQNMVIQLRNVVNLKLQYIFIARKKFWPF